MKYIKLFEKEFKNIEFFSKFNSKYHQLEPLKKKIYSLEDAIKSEVKLFINKKGKVKFIPINKEDYKVYFNNSIDKLYDELEETKKALNKIERDGTFFTNKIFFNLNKKQNNRIHFSEGIPSFLKGMNLGYYLYKEFAKEMKIITSNTEASDNIRGVWEKLIKDKDFTAIFFHDKKGYNICIINKENFHDADVKSIIVNWSISCLSYTNDVIIDDFTAKNLKFNFEDFKIKKGMFLELCNNFIAFYERNKWKFISNKNNDITNIIKRDINIFLNNK